jgi:paraquat-inducible protein A
MSKEVRPYPDLMLCEHCDEVYQRQTLARGTSYFCSRCGSRLGRSSLLSVSAWLALTITAGCLFIFDNTFPVALISFDGLQSEATVWQSICALAQGPGAPTAIAAGIVIIGVPGFQIALLLWLLCFAVAGKGCPYFVLTLRFLHLSRPWGMTEVFLLGVLVAIIKLSSYLHVVIGAGVISVALLAPLMVVITTHDTDELWHLFERSAVCRAA